MLALNEKGAAIDVGVERRAVKYHREKFPLNVNVPHFAVSETLQRSRLWGGLLATGILVDFKTSICLHYD